MRNPIVAYCPAAIDACALYRMFIPHLHTPKSLFIFSTGRLPFDEIASAEVVQVQRQCTKDNIAALDGMKQLGQKIVYDLDDNLWNLPRYNLAKRAFDAYRHGFLIAMDKCDVLTVSTEALKTAVKTSTGLHKEIVVVPNAVDLEVMPKAPLQRRPGKVVIGWGGTNSHGGDVEEAWNALPKVLQESENAWLEVVGLPPPSRLEKHPRVRERAFVPVAEFYSRLATWNWDIMLAPLENNRFNRSKSNIKMLESAAMRAPCLVSPVQPYLDFIKYDKELEYLLCYTSKDWLRKLLDLVSEKERRDYLASRMLAVVKEHYSMEKVRDRWHNIYSDIVQ